MKINFKYTEKPRKSKICTQCLQELPKGSPRYLAESVFSKDNGIGYVSMYMCVRCKSMTDYLEKYLHMCSDGLGIFYLYDFSKQYLENYTLSSHDDKEMFYISKDILNKFSKNYTLLKENDRLEEINDSLR